MLYAILTGISKLPFIMWASSHRMKGFLVNQKEWQQAAREQACPSPGAPDTGSACGALTEGGQWGFQQAPLSASVVASSGVGWVWAVGRRWQHSQALGLAALPLQAQDFKKCKKASGFREEIWPFIEQGGKSREQYLPEDYLNNLLSVPEAKSIITLLLLPWTSFCSVNEMILIICPR